MVDQIVLKVIIENVKNVIIFFLAGGYLIYFLKERVRQQEKKEQVVKQILKKINYGIDDRDFYSRMLGKFEINRDTFSLELSKLGCSCLRSIDDAIILADININDQKISNKIDQIKLLASAYDIAKYQNKDKTPDTRAKLKAAQRELSLMLKNWLKLKSKK